MNIQLLQRQLLIKQSVFGLTWLMAGALLPFCQNEIPTVTWQKISLLLLAFMSARFSGMCFNHLIDVKFDAKNPRTKGRPLPNGDITFALCLFQALFFLFLFLSAAWLLNPLCGYLSLIVGSLVVLYSYTKRFTHLCHFVLGSVHFFAPIAAWAAMTGEIAPAPIFLGFALLFSIAAGDIIYACQDIAFDRMHGLYSIPAAFGEKVAHLLAGLLHLISIAFLFLVSYELDSTPLFLSSFAVSLLYAYGHLKLYTREFGYELTFAFINTLAGLILLAFTVGAIIHLMFQDLGIWHAL